MYVPAVHICACMHLYVSVRVFARFDVCWVVRLSYQQVDYRLIDVSQL